MLRGHIRDNDFGYIAFRTIEACVACSPPSKCFFKLIYTVSNPDNILHNNYSYVIWVDSSQKQLRETLRAAANAFAEDHRLYYSSLC